MSIKLSPKHGVNPTMGRCMWCGKPTGEIAMLGKLPGDAEAPKYSTLSYEPCDECKEVWQKGVTFIECSYERKDERPAFTKDTAGEEAYPTGRFIVITEEAANHLFVGDFKAGKVYGMDLAAYAFVEEFAHQCIEADEPEVSED